MAILTFQKALFVKMDVQKCSTMTEKQLDLTYC